MRKVFLRAIFICLVLVSSVGSPCFGLRLLPRSLYLKVFAGKKRGLFANAGKGKFGPEKERFFNEIHYIKKSNEGISASIKIENNEKWDSTVDKLNSILTDMEAIRKKYNYPFQEKIDVKQKVFDLRQQILQVEYNDKEYQEIKGEIKAFNDRIFFSGGRIVFGQRFSLTRGLGLPGAYTSHNIPAILSPARQIYLRIKLKKTKAYLDRQPLQEQREELKKRLSWIHRGDIRKRVNKAKKEIKKLRKKYFSLVTKLMGLF